jgi:hypothetical protein
MPTNGEKDYKPSPNVRGKTPLFTTTSARSVLILTTLYLVLTSTTSSSVMSTPLCASRYASLCECVVHVFHEWVPPSEFGAMVKEALLTLLGVLGLFICRK